MGQILSLRIVILRAKRFNGRD